MFDPLLLQARVLALVVGLGALLGLFFDVYRVMRGRLHPGKKGTLLGDLLFWTIATVTAFFILLAGNWGELRLYVWFGCLLGLVLYHLLLSRLVIRLLVGLWTAAARALGVAWTILQRLARVPLQWGRRLWRRSRILESLRALWRWLRNPPSPPSPPAAPDPPAGGAPTSSPTPGASGRVVSPDSKRS